MKTTQFIRVLLTGFCAKVIVRLVSLGTRRKTLTIHFKPITGAGKQGWRGVTVEVGWTCSLGCLPRGGAWRASAHARPLGDRAQCRSTRPAPSPSSLQSAKHNERGGRDRHLLSEWTLTRCLARWPTKGGGMNSNSTGNLFIFRKR